MIETLLERTLRGAGLDEAVTARTPLGGGCIHRVERVRLERGRTAVAKIAEGPRAGMLAEERRGLEALRATETVRVPRVLAHEALSDAAVLLLEDLPTGSPGDDDWAAFGADLARLHRAPAGERYGFDHDNHLGATPQPNGWSDDWVEFNRSQRIGHQLDGVRRGGRAPWDARGRDLLDQAMAALPAVLPRRPRPSLLHGDLWSGNALALASGGVAVIDPACSIGDGLADVAMMRLFGGFPEACTAAYAAVWEDAGEPLPAADEVERRIAVYQLYHVLNHVTLFGVAYADQALRLAQRVVDGAEGRRGRPTTG